MGDQETTRKLTAILSADVFGYSRLMGQDEEATVRTLTAYRQVFLALIPQHQGRVVDAKGDALLAEFPTVTDAVRCAVAIQQELAERNASLPAERAMTFRIGLNLGEVLVKGEEIYGDGVNIAARLEALAEPGGLCISGSVYDNVQNRLELAYEYLGEQEVKNIRQPVRAYRVIMDAESIGQTHPAKPMKRTGHRTKLVAAAVVLVLVIAGFVTWQMTRSPEPVTKATTEDPILALPKRPKIAVLPFVNMSGDPEQEYFSDGVTEDIIIGLSKFPDFQIAAADSTFQYKDTNVAMQKVASDLGADYLLEGNVRRAADTIRVTVKLLDAQAGGHLWAETYERDLTPENIFLVQDDITSQVIAKIGEEWGIVAGVELHRTRTKAPENLASYDCMLRVYDFYRSLDAKKHFNVRACLEATVERDPDYTVAWAYLANVYNEEYANEFNPRPNPLDRSLKAALRAVALDSRSFLAHAGLADVYYYRGELEPYVATAERALELNPHNSTRVGLIGVQMAHWGMWERGVALTKRAMQLNPDHPGWLYIGLVLNHYNRKDYEHAKTDAEKMGMPDYFYAEMLRASIYGQLGQTQRATQHAEKVLELDPAFLQHPRDMYRRHNVREPLIEHLMDGLRKAGLDIPPE